MKTTVNTKRLLKLATFLDTLPRSHFDFNISWERDESNKCATNQCGAVGCAVGWTPTVFPKVVKHHKGCSNRFSMKGFLNTDGGSHLDYSEVARHLFGMPFDHALNIFTPDRLSPVDSSFLPEKATPKQVAKRIRKYVAWAIKEEIISLEHT